MSNSTQNKCPFCKSELISLVLPSNPPQYKTYCPNCEKYKVSNSTQNDEIGKMEKAIDEGFAESERDLKDKKTPLDQPTQNDWDEELYKVACHIHAESMAYKFGMAGFDEPEVIIYRRLKQLIADARREVIADLFSNQDFLNNLKWTIQDHMNRAFKDFNEDYFIHGEMRDVGAVADRTVEAILATLREEEKHG